MRKGEDCVKELTNVAEFGQGKRIFSVTAEEYAPTPASELLCGNFIEVGFGYQVESMWTEMFYNRSFEKVFPIAKGTYDWFGGNDKGLGNDWTKEEWYHSAYQHSRWYAFPGKDRPESITADATYLTEITPGYSLRLSMEKGGVHGEHCLVIDNFDSRPAGVAQDGKYLRSGETYHFSGWLQLLSGESEGAEILFYRTDRAQDEEPLARAALPSLSAEGAWVEMDFPPAAFDVWATFALCVPGGTKVLCDAFSLMPAHSCHGWRPDVVEALRELKPSVMRFPGGNFGSLHLWTDAIGPKNSRRPEPSVMWGDLNYNDVGTDEFLDLCEQTGTEPLLLVNMLHPLKQFYFLAFPEITEWGGLQRHGQNLTRILDKEGGIELARRWVEYCNGDVSTPMGRLRAENGHPEPYHVKYWEMDNETWRWFTKEEYAEYVNRYAAAMRSVDPTIEIGICSYHTFSDVIEDILELCGESVNFIADRMCEPFNIKRKIAIVQRYNETHEHQIYYTDTEALQNRDLTLAPFTKKYYAEHDLDFCRSRRAWLYALTMAGNLLHYQRYGDLARFMCFNNLCNTSGQSCIEASKEETILTCAGILMAHMARTKAAWPLRVEGYEPDSLKSIELQVSWDRNRESLVIHLVNKCDEPTPVTLDLSHLGRRFTSYCCTRLSAADGAVQETIRSHGHIREETHCGSLSSDVPCTFDAPAFSFSEIVLQD